MKKKIRLFFAILFILIISVVPAFAETTVTTNGDYEYEICESLFESGKTVVYISDYVATNSNAIILIPTNIDGYEVEGIGHFAFQENETVEEIYANDGLKFIGYFAFSECPRLKKIHLPDSVETILDGAFLRCNQISYFDIPKEIKSVGECIISGSKLKTIKNNSSLDLDISLAIDAIDDKHSWFLDERGSEKAMIVPSNSTIYKRRVNFDYSELYAYEYMREVSGEIVPMSIANTEDEIIEYFKSRSPSGKPDSVDLSITVVEFIPAVAGTRYDTDGETGYSSVLINFTNSLDEDDVAEVRYYSIIEPTQYSGGSSGGGSSSGGSSSGGGGNRTSTNSQNNGMSVTKESVKNGNWEQVGGLWKLKLPDSSYATSQWALLNDKWYLLGTDGIMKTEWQKVNGKWYYLFNDGSMLIGWQLIEDKWYWMDNTGAMLDGGNTPDGYSVNENGEWLQ